MPETLGFGFDLGRTDGYPTRYGDQYTAAHVDVFVAGLITAFVILGLGLFAIIPAYNPLMRKILFCRIFCSLFIGGVILVGNYGHHWEKGVIKMSAPYKPGIPDEIQGVLGLHISLRGINITLKGEPAKHGPPDNSNHPHLSPLSKERIDYNEHFSWEWAQGRFGFGKYAGRISRDFRAAVMQGVPLPILQVAEYFTFDGEGIRFGRHYRLAGWFTHLILWFAFGTWLITNILFCMVIRTAALFLFFTGCLQLAAVRVWTCIRNFIELSIPFQTYDGSGEIILKTHFGADYYLVFANGIFCILMSGMITILDALIPDEMCQYFGIDPLTIYDELLISKEEIREEKRRMSVLLGDTVKTDDVEMNLAGTSARSSAAGGNQDESEPEVFLRKRSNKASQFVRKSIRHMKPRVPRRSKGISGTSGTAEERVRTPLLEKPIATSDTSDDEIGDRRVSYDSGGSWPAPPSESYLNLRVPPTPPPKPRKFK